MPFSPEKIPFLSRILKEQKLFAPLPQKEGTTFDLPITETSFLRARDSISVLTEAIGDSQKPPNILIVGVGNDADPIFCPYVPYKLAAFLESLNLDYGMTLVDVSPEVIEDIRTRNTIYVSHNQFNKPVNKALTREMKKYLRHTGSRMRITHEPEPGIIFHDYIANPGGLVSPKNYLKRGFYAAPIPLSFEHKRDAGEIPMINGSITDMTTVPGAPFDFVDMMNVLYMLSRRDQHKVLENLSNAMNPGGLLLVNDLGYVGTPMMLRLGGWADARALSDIGFIRHKIISQKEESEHFVLKKIE